MALQGSGNDKAPGPDGIYFSGIKKLWKWIKEDCLKYIMDFMENGKLPAGINCSFITLIPKVPNPKQMTDFRPISLINCSLKLLTKILANRLQGVMEKLISSSQSGFMKNRLISESILMVNEIEHSMKSGKKRYHSQTRL